MKAAREMAAETKTESSGAMPGFDHELDGDLALEDFQRVLAKRAPESQTKGQASFVRYLVSICIGVIATLAWQSYGEATKQTPATTALELAWSPESNLARWVQELGSQKRSRLASGPRDFSTATRCTGGYGKPQRRGAATADSGEPGHAAANR
jgi:hypothetical protein